MKALELPERPSLHGVTRFEVRTDQPTTPCWLFAHSFPSWSGALAALHFRPTRCFLTDGRHVELVKSVLGPSVKVVVAIDQRVEGPLVLGPGGEEERVLGPGGRMGFL